MKIEEMEAGPALDALVAERVMGAKRLESCGLHHNCKKDSGRYGWQHANGVGNHHLPSYSTDIAAAWQVVEKLWPAVQGGGYGIFRIHIHRRDGDGQWGCEFAVDPDGDFSTHAVGKADTAPLAVCRAALLAVGAKP